MNQLYFRDLRHRVEALEEKFFPEPEPEAVLCWEGEDGLPEAVFHFGTRSTTWQRKPGEPIPKEYLDFATPAARAALQAQQQTAHSP